MDLFSRRLLQLLAVDALLVLPFLGGVPLWNIDEGRIAEVAREMGTTGDWLVPRIGGEPFGSYPPLGYWLMTPSGLLLGWTEFAMRLPLALAGLGLIAAVAVLARRLAGDEAGLFAGVVIATTVGFYSQQVRCRADVLVTLFAVLAFDRFLVVAGGDKRPRQLVLFYLWMGMGILSKTLVAPAICGMGVLAWMIVHRQWRVLLDLKPWFGVPAMLAFLSPWYVLVYRAAGWEFLKLNLIGENVSAFTTAQSSGHGRPFHFYFGAAPGRLAPWLLFLPFAWMVRRTRGLALGLAWFGLVFAFLTFSASKRPNYIVYLCPGFAVAAGATLAALWTDVPARLRAILLGLGGLAAVAALIVGFAPIQWHRELTPALSLFPAFGVVGAALGLVLVGVAALGGARPGAWTLAGVTVLWLAAFLALVQPRTDVVGRNAMPFCRRVADAVPATEALRQPLDADLGGSYHFYLDRTIAKGDGPGWYLATESQCDQFTARGLRVTTVDSVADERGRLKLLVRVSE